ncbi:hypothetical protein N8772_00065 [Rickettsiales bacterium]|nr:hypothetical protein [Rickettsiales bacterium]MDB2550652.1 hypothetical protein [Rickettsiales bacterium]
MNNKFNNLLDKFPHLALYLLKTLIPILSVIFVLSFITLSTELLCPDQVLAILFDIDEDYEPTKRYLAFEQFINSGKEFIYYIIDQIANFFKYMLHDLMPNHHFGDFTRPTKCLEK